ncbi:MAG: putative molybdenum carrier protein [Bacteroidales bacterium]|nr:putative molybdenum carrier protein [Bacteroidales bacterium]
MIRKVISGGQTGVDRAALDAALYLGFETGGWCPPGKVGENGNIPPEYNLIETERERSDRAPGIPRSQRTENNVRFSDATLILIPGNIERDSGTEWTLECARYYNKPCFSISPYHPRAKRRIIEWICEVQPEVVNVAGPSENTSPGVYEQSYKILVEILNK